MHNEKHAACIILAVKPRHAAKLLSGEKKVEFRRTRPRIGIGCVVLIYESSPVMAITGYYTVRDNAEGSPAHLWNCFKEHAGITWSEFHKYFAGKKKGYGIEVDSKVKLANSVGLETLRKRYSGFSAPQSYRYFESNLMQEILSSL